MRTIPSGSSPCRLLRPTSLGSGNSIRRSIPTRRRVLGTRATIAWTPAAPPYWSAEMMHTTVIERLARLRGIGDAYHDYRGELQHFSLQTKAGILRAMGCATEDDAALAAAVRQLESEHRVNFLPKLHAFRGPRAAVEINVPARVFGAILQWTVNLEDGERRKGTVSSADCPEVWRGEMDGSWITRRLFEVPLELPPGYHTLEVKVGGG